ncbi:DUF2705 family protein [Priestia megaterium]|uniref:DUF2705 family protein n=1 Tax=Priestia TaxID=2800373 RepID=UPI003687C281
MVHSKRIFICVIFIIIIQSILLSNIDVVEFPVTFLDGIPITSSFALENRFLLLWYLPVIAISFYFSGYMSDMLRTYGKVVIVRNYSKSMWVIKQYLSMIKILLVFVLCQIGAFYFSTLGNSIFSSDEIIKLIIVYFFTLNTLFCIQTFLELYISPQVSQLIINLYIIFSILITKALYFISAPKLLYYFLLPNYGMGFKIGVGKHTEFQTHILQYWSCFIVLIIIQITIWILSIFRLKKMDIL